MRYARQGLVVGKERQEQLARSTVAVLGLGAIGSVAAEMLARSGVNLLLIDRDIVEESNLSRQLFEEKDVGTPKAPALQRRLREVNSTAGIDAVFDDFNADTAEPLLKNVDFAIDGFDNLYSRFLLNDACLNLNIPFTYAAAVHARGLFAVVMPHRTACLRCFLPYPQGQLETCESAGILAPVSGTVGMLAASEAIKCLSGFGSPRETLLSMDFEKNTFVETALKKKKGCAACSGVYEYLSGAVRRAPVIELCAGSYYIRIPGRIDVGAVAGAGPNSKSVAHLQAGKMSVTLFSHGMIVRNAASGKEARSVAEKIASF